MARQNARPAFPAAFRKRISVRPRSVDFCGGRRLRDARYCRRARRAAIDGPGPVTLGERAGTPRAQIVARPRCHNLVLGAVCARVFMRTHTYVLGMIAGLAVGLTAAPFTSWSRLRGSRRPDRPGQLLRGRPYGGRRGQSEESRVHGDHERGQRHQGVARFPAAATSPPVSICSPSAPSDTR